MSIDLRLPNINAKTDSERIAQLTRYIYQLTEQLTFSFNTIETTLGSISDENTLSPAVSLSALSENEKLEESYSYIKYMIIKSADFTSSVTDVIHTQLDGSYIAKSDFGEYLENTSLEINGNSVGFTQLYSYSAGIRSDFADFDVNNQTFIKTGLLYYNDSTPIYGVGIGLIDSTTDVNGNTVIDRSGLLATYTADEIAFWSNDEQIASIKPSEVYFPNGILKAYGATITGDIKGGTININDNFSVDSDGNVIIKKGAININDKFKVDDKGKVTITSGSISITDGTYNGRSFMVTGSGDLWANSVKVTGEINATSGMIGGFDITEDYISSNGRTGVEDPTNGVFISPDGISLFGESGSFLVNPAGHLYATNAEISGTINATEGEIAGFIIGEKALSREDISTSTIEDCEIKFREAFELNNSTNQMKFISETIENDTVILHRSTKISCDGITVKLSGRELPSEAHERSFMKVETNGTTYELYVDPTTMTVKATTV